MYVAEIDICCKLIDISSLVVVGCMRYNISHSGIAGLRVRDPRLQFQGGPCFDGCAEPHALEQNLDVVNG